jgi:hypothetical protein
MVCAPTQNDVRSWQNGVRAICDVTDVLGEMMCALMCALVCALMCAPVAGVPVAQRISNFCLRHLVALKSATGGVTSDFSAGDRRWVGTRRAGWTKGSAPGARGILAFWRTTLKSAKIPLEKLKGNQQLCRQEVCTELWRRSFSRE